MRPMELFEKADLSAEWTERRAAEDRAAGEVSELKMSVEGLNVRVTWVAWRGNECRGPRARAATAPVVRAVWIVDRDRSAGKKRLPSSLYEEVGMSTVM